MFLVAVSVALLAVMSGCGGSAPESTTAGAAAGETDAGTSAQTGAPAETGAAGEATAETSAAFELRIGNVLPFTGDLAPYGPGLDQAARIAADQINESLDRLGLADQISVTIVGSEDSQTQAAAAVEAATKLVNSENATVIIGDMASTSSIPMAQSVTIPNNVVQIAPTASAPQMFELEDDGYVFQMLAPDTLESAGSVRAAQLAFGKTATINFGARNDAFGSAFMPLFLERWKAEGGKVGEAFLWNPNQASYDTEAQRLVRGDPDGWVIIDFPGTAAKVLPALVRTGSWDPRRTIVNEAFKDGGFLQEVGDQATAGLRGTAPTSTGPAADAFGTLFEQLKEEGTATSGYEATTFDAVMLAFLAALKAGSAEGSAIKTEMQAVAAPPGTAYSFVELDQAIQAILAGEDVDYGGAFGPLDLAEQGGPLTVLDELWTYEGNGTVTRLQLFEVS